MHLFHIAIISGKSPYQLLCEKLPQEKSWRKTSPTGFGTIVLLRLERIDSM
jgi:hypothetical protein